MIQEALFMLRRWRNEFSPRRVLSAWLKNISAWSRFWKSYQQYIEAANIKDKSLLDNLYPCLGDDTVETVIEPTYFYQDAWAFEQIFKASPSHHIDVGSHHKFVALLSKVFPVTMVDIRPLSLPLNTLKFQQGSILDLPFADKSIESLSSLCVVEHIGLSRYGDPIDPNGTEKAIEELKRVIKPDGNLYISLPLQDKNKIYFNAHRAFSESYVYKLFNDFELVQSRYIYGNEFGENLKLGFGIGCYQFRRV
jgi:SAM-dependent methyltransferase